MSRSLGGGTPIDPCVGRDSGLMLYVFVYGVERGSVPHKRAFWHQRPRNATDGSLDHDRLPDR